MEWFSVITTLLLFLCGVIEVFTPSTSPEYRIADLIKGLLSGSALTKLGSALSVSLSTSSSPLTTGRLSSGAAPTRAMPAPAPTPSGPVVPQRAPEQDQEGMP